MAERFLGAVLRRPRDEQKNRPSLGEIGLNHFAPYMMNRIMARWNGHMADELKAHGMTTIRMRALAVLSVSGSLTINELSDFAVTEQSTMSRTLDALEEQGYIRRQPRAEDMRIRDVAITEDGRETFEKCWPTMYEAFLKMFDGIDEKEYRTFLATLHKVLANVHEHGL
jgi:DNA-binding MarR family transcriptional regulator